MKRFLTKIFTVLFLTLAVPATSLAESSTVTIGELPVDMSAMTSPETLDPGFKTESQDNAGRSLIAITNGETDSRIELYARKMLKDSHANTLFEMFRKNISDTKDYTLYDRIEDNVVYESPVQSIKGTRAEYEYGTIDTAIRILTYSFAVTSSDSGETTAMILVGYFPTNKTAYDNGRAMFEKILNSMVSGQNVQQVQ